MRKRIACSDDAVGPATKRSPISSLSAPERVQLSQDSLDRIARTCMSTFVMSYKGVTSQEAVWMAIFREAAQLHECIRANPSNNAHLLYTRCLSDLRHPIRVINDDESPMQVFLEPGVRMRSYSISEGPRADIIRTLAPGYYAVRHPFLRMVIFHPRCVG